MMELKYAKKLFDPFKEISLNRTMMELKFGWVCHFAQKLQPLNRTMMELKFPKIGGVEVGTFPLIVP